MRAKQDRLLELATNLVGVQEQTFNLGVALKLRKELEEYARRIRSNKLDDWRGLASQ